MSTSDSDQLPYATAKGLRILGKIRERAEDFEVREIAAYEPAGHGEHLLVHFEKTGLNTQDAVRRIARALDSDASQAGWAGLKDRQAVTTQWASFFSADAGRARALELPGIRVLDARPHPHKLRTGHLRGNRFRIRIRGAAEGLETARAVLGELAAHGTPNYYGEQRFGRDAQNAPRARRWLAENGPAPRDRFERKLLASSLQASWFNTWLADRVREGALGVARAGDLMRKEDSGGLFVTGDLADAEARVASFSISPTGPMFGAKMRWPEAEALRIEQALWAREGLPDAALARWAKLLPGTRRVARMRPEQVELRPVDQDLEVAFTLQKGAYATVVLRELLKSSAPQPVEDALEDEEAL
ncbi:MAG: tRNA pseudouridine(13) synthase TruD [Polyangiales bacterium]